MTLDEFKGTVGSIIGEGDANVRTQAGQSLIDAFTELDATNTQLTTANADLTERNKKLNEANASMFLRTIGKTDDPTPEHEETPRERFNRLFDEKYNKKG